MTSGKDIVPPRKTQMEEYKALIDHAGPNAHDRAHVLICAVIGDGIDTIEKIMNIAMRLGFVRGHIANRLKDGEAHHWRRNKAGIYSLI